MKYTIYNAKLDALKKRFKTNSMDELKAKIFGGEIADEDFYSVVLEYGGAIAFKTEETEDITKKMVVIKGRDILGTWTGFLRHTSVDIIVPLLTLSEDRAKHLSKLGMKSRLSTAATGDDTVKTFAEFGHGVSQLPAMGTVTIEAPKSWMEGAFAKSPVASVLIITDTDGVEVKHTAPTRVLIQKLNFQELQRVGLKLGMKVEPSWGIDKLKIEIARVSESVMSSAEFAEFIKVEESVSIEDAEYPDLIRMAKVLHTEGKWEGKVVGLSAIDLKTKLKEHYGEK